MANTASVVTKISSNVIPFEQGMKRAQAVAKSAASSIQGDFKSAAKEMSGSFGGIGRAIGVALAGAGAVAGVVMMADSFHQLEQRIKTATAATGDFEQVNEALFEITQSNGVAFASTVEIFQKLAMSAKDLGATNKDIEIVVDTVQKLGVISGTAGQQLDSALLQLSQALGSGKLQGDELKSIMENMPILARKIAQGLDVSVGSLKKMGAEGKLTSKAVFDAILKAAPEAQKMFEGMSLSVGASFTKMGNEAGKFVAEFDRFFPITTAVKGAMDLVTEAIKLAGEKLKDFMAISVQVGAIHTDLGKTIKASWIGIGGVIQAAWQNFKDFAHGASAEEAAANQKKITDQTAKSITDTLKGVEKASVTMSNSTSKAVADVDKKGLALAKRQAEAFKKFLTNLQEQDKELDLHLAHRDKEIQLTKTLAQAEASVGRPLKENERTLIGIVEQSIIRKQATSDAADYVRSLQQENEMLQGQLSWTEDLVKARQELTNYIKQHPNTSADDINKIRQEMSARIEQTKAVKDQANQQQEYSQLYEQYKSLLQDTQTPLENYKQKINEIKFLMATGIIPDTETYNKLLAAQVQKLNEAQSADHFDTLKQQFQDVQQLISLTTPLRTFNAELKKLQDLQAGGVLSTTQYNTGVAQLNQNLLQATGGLTQLQQAQITYHQNLDALDAALKAGTLSQSQYTQAVNMNKQTLTSAVPVVGELQQAFGTAFSSAITGAQSFSQVLDNLLQQLLNIATQTLIIKPFTNALGNVLGGLFSGGTGGGFLGSIGKFLGFASGGDPPTNRYSWVGENGPELIKPRGATTVVPLNKLSAGGGASAQVNVQIVNNNNSEIRQSQKQNSDGSIDQVIELVAKKIGDDYQAGKGPIYKAVTQTHSLKMTGIRR